METNEKQTEVESLLTMIRFEVEAFLYAALAYGLFLGSVTDYLEPHAVTLRVSAVVVVVGPLVFRMIFGVMPLRALRLRIAGIPFSQWTNELAASTKQEAHSIKWLLETQDTSIRLLTALAIRSERSAKELSGRAKVYLFCRRSYRVWWTRILLYSHFRF